MPQVETISRNHPALEVVTGGVAHASEFHREWMKALGRGAGDGELVGLAFDFCNGMVYAVATRITGSRWEAEDITQSVFENFASKLHKVRDPARIPGYLKSTAVRMATKQVKRGRWRRQKAKDHFETQDALTRTDEAAMAAQVQQLLGCLNAEERSAVVLKYIEMHSHAEVAEIMGVSVATARRRLDSAKKKLAALIGPRVATEILGEGESA